MPYSNSNIDEGKVVENETITGNRVNGQNDKMDLLLLISYAKMALQGTAHQRKQATNRQTKYSYE